MQEPGHILSVEIDALDGVTIVRLVGEVDVSTADALTDAVDNAPGPVVMDLSGVTFMDSSGVRALVEAQHHAVENERVFALYRPSPRVVRLLELIDLRDMFTEVTDIDPSSLRALR